MPSGTTAADSPRIPAKTAPAPSAAPGFAVPRSDAQESASRKAAPPGPRLRGAALVRRASRNALDVGSGIGAW
jgi:hypothetical protein